MNKKEIFPKTFTQKFTSDWILNEMEIRIKSTEVKESYLKSYFNLMYYMFFIPFKIQVDHKNGEYVLKSNKIQKVSNSVELLNRGLQNKANSKYRIHSLRAEQSIYSCWLPQWPTLSRTLTIFSILDPTFLNFLPQLGIYLEALWH